MQALQIGCIGPVRRPRFDRAQQCLSQLKEGIRFRIDGEECAILTSTSQSNVIWSQDKEFQVHNFPETTLLNGMDSLKHNDRGRFDSWCDICALMKRKVVRWDFNILTREQFIQLFESQVKIESLRVIKVIVSCVFVLIISTINRSKSVSCWSSDKFWLTRVPCKTCLVQAALSSPRKR